MKDHHRERPTPQSGAVAQLELVLVGAVIFCVVLVSGGVLLPKIILEIRDLKVALGGLNQSYVLTGLAVGHPNDLAHPTDVASWQGSAFANLIDEDATCGVRNCQAPTPEEP